MHSGELEHAAFLPEIFPVSDEVEAGSKALVEATLVFLKGQGELLAETVVSLDVLADRPAVVLRDELPIEVFGKGIEVQTGPHARDGGEIDALDFRFQPGGDVNCGRLDETFQLAVITGDRGGERRFIVKLLEEFLDEKLNRLFRCFLACVRLKPLEEA